MRARQHGAADGAREPGQPELHELPDVPGVVLIAAEGVGNRVRDRGGVGGKAGNRARAADYATEVGGELEARVVGDRLANGPPARVQLR